MHKHVPLPRAALLYGAFRWNCKLRAIDYYGEGNDNAQAVLEECYEEWPFIHPYSLSVATSDHIRNLKQFVKDLHERKQSKGVCDFIKDFTRDLHDQLIAFLKTD